MTPRQPALRIAAMPADANPNGVIFGGWVVAQIDIAGAIVAMERARGRVATVAINAVQFHERVEVGDLLSFYAEIVKVGQTSITVAVDVEARRNPERPRTVKVTEATLTYVAIDDAGNKREVPPQG